jgi:GR25 family glycosyltransferase involved in LPS biosynthesis
MTISPCSQRLKRRNRIIIGSIPNTSCCVLAWMAMASVVGIQIQAFTISNQHRHHHVQATNGRRIHHDPSRLQATTAVETTTSATTTSAALDWSFLDGVYLIHCPNGDPQGKRLSSTEIVLQNVNLLDDVVIKEFETDDENRIRGCYASHLSVYRDILRDQDNSRAAKNNNGMFDFWTAFQPSFNNDEMANNNQNILILEDNLALNCGTISQKSLQSIAAFVESNTDWDVMHLAYIPYVPDLQISRTSNQDIVKLSTGIGSALGTTAYIINTQAMRRLVQEDDQNGFQIPIPDVMAKLFGESRYASNPTLFVRAPSTKSLVNPQLDDLREILFQPVVAAFAQRLLVWTGLSTNALLPLVVVALLTTSIASLQTTANSVFQYWNTGSLDGPWIVPLLSVPFSLFSLALIVQGALLAPKPEKNG